MKMSTIKCRQYIGCEEYNKLLYCLEIRGPTLANK